jgi:hypothetical protein
MTPSGATSLDAIQNDDNMRTRRADKPIQK